VPMRSDPSRFCSHFISVSPHMGVVVTSGRADVNPFDLPAGAKFLPKPYNATVAIATVESVIQRRRGSEEAVAS